jgi:hypothetical protein
MIEVTQLNISLVGMAKGQRADWETSAVIVYM